MSRRQNFWERLSENTDLMMEPLPGQTVIELADTCRVLIENHMGIKAYSREKIIVNVKYGCACICGCSLELAQMTQERLVICGKIDGISLQRRG